MQVSNKRKGVIGGTVLVLAMALVLGADVWAQPGSQGFGGSMGGRHGGMLRGLRQLELTDAQREQIREMHVHGQLDDAKPHRVGRGLVEAGDPEHARVAALLVGRQLHLVACREPLELRELAGYQYR